MKIYSESLPGAASEVDTKDKSIGEEVKSQVLYLLSEQEQGLQGPWLHSALEKTHAEACLQICCLTPTVRELIKFYC